ncbi:MAG: DUF551 domain-containing protein [Synergistaceae bacterium]|nr:DUF551 domain-containing protein [Synergistaceae bacterium]
MENYAPPTVERSKAKYACCHACYACNYDSQIGEKVDEIFTITAGRMNVSLCRKDLAALRDQIELALGEGWISVEDKLPDYDCDVLAYYGFDKGDGFVGRMYMGVLTYFAADEKPHFQHASTGLRATHWRSLPAIPSDKRGETC